MDGFLNFLSQQSARREYRVDRLKRCMGDWTTSPRRPCHSQPFVPHIKDMKLFFDGARGIVHRCARSVVSTPKL
jgi:hypothetical protein